MLAWHWTQRLIGRKSQTPACEGAIGDQLHRWTAPLHRRLSVNPRLASFTLIVSSLFIDLFGLYLFGSAIFGPTTRPFVAILILFGLRQICQVICTLPPPPGMIWRDPGFPTLLVTYHVSNDLFFSGHTAFCVLGALQLFHTGPLWAIVLGVFVTLAEALAVIVLRAHYTMDVFAAIFVAWAADHLAGMISGRLDLALATLAGILRH